MPWLVYSGSEEGGDSTFHHRPNVNFEFSTVCINATLLVRWMKMKWAQKRGSSTCTDMEGTLKRGQIGSIGK